MRLKESILSTWKSRDVRKTSSLRPTFISSADSRSRGSTLGKTFTPRQPVPSSSVLRGPGGGGDAIATSSSVFKPLAPPPGIPIAPGLSHYLQDPMPASFPAMGPPAEYNFDPITGRPLRASTPDVLSRFSQSRDASLPTPISPRVTSLSDLLRSSVEERPLVVGSASHLSRVVTGERMQIMTVFPSAADTTLSSSATTAPRISTSSSNVVEGDVRRVIRRDQAPSPNKVLARSGVGRGTARRPVRQSTGRGQGLAGMLADSAGRVGRGRSTPSPPVGRSGQGKRWTSTHTETGLPQWSRCIWIIRVWPLPTRRPPPGHLGELKLLLLSQCRATCASNWRLVKRKRRLPGPRWNEYAGRNERRMPPARNVRSRSSVELNGAASCIVWREKGPGNRRSTTVIAEPRGLS